MSFTASQRPGLWSGCRHPLSCDFSLTVQAGWVSCCDQLTKRTLTNHNIRVSTVSSSATDMHRMFSKVSWSLWAADIRKKSWHPSRKFELVYKNKMAILNYCVYLKAKQLLVRCVCEHIFFLSVRKLTLHARHSLSPALDQCFDTISLTDTTPSQEFAVPQPQAGACPGVCSWPGGRKAWAVCNEQCAAWQWVHAMDSCIKFCCSWLGWVRHISCHPNKLFVVWTYSGGHLCRDSRGWEVW